MGLSDSIHLSCTINPQGPSVNPTSPKQKPTTRVRIVQSKEEGPAYVTINHPIKYISVNILQWEGGFACWQGMLVCVPTRGRVVRVDIFSA